MKKVLLAAAITLLLALSSTGPASAADSKKQPESNQQHPGEAVAAHLDVCVNQSNAAAAKALFPTARLHIIPDSPHAEENGWVVIVGFGEHPHTDAEEIAIRMRERNKGMRGE